MGSRSQGESFQPISVCAHASVNPHYTSRIAAFFLFLAVYRLRIYCPEGTFNRSTSLLQNLASISLCSFWICPISGISSEGVVRIFPVSFSSFPASQQNKQGEICYEESCYFCRHCDVSFCPRLPPFRTCSAKDIIPISCTICVATLLS